MYDPPGTEVVRHSRTRHRSPGYDNRVVEFADTYNGGLNNSITPAARSEHYFSESKELNNHPKSPKVHYTEHVSETVGADALRALELDDNLLPPANTKVTTTVKTYTYELPEEPEVGLINKKMHFKDESYNRTTTLPSFRAERDIPLESLPPGSNSQLTTYRQDAQYPTMIDGMPSNTQSKAMYFKKETKSSNTTMYPGQPDPTLLPRLTAPVDDGSGRPVQVYQETMTHRGPPGSVPSDPYGMNTVTYRFQSSNTNYNSRFPPPEREPLLPAFPTDHVDNRHIEQPPKRVEDLMASLGEVSNQIFKFLSKNNS